ncbi:hypothetical protein QWY13_00635 [Planococcus sp. N017]|uniref:Uncharacterized protein n=1 Tax=Planococcus shenhongbingii TaxID=3058398 RepID=A0ABT8N7Y1_9BACL|nr:hypothetical protein [Planococcus sp. N017]
MVTKHYPSKRLVVRNDQGLFVAEFWHERDIGYVVVAELISGENHKGFYTFDEINEEIIDEAVNQFIKEFK